MLNYSAVVKPSSSRRLDPGATATPNSPSSSPAPSPRSRPETSVAPWTSAWGGVPSRPASRVERASDPPDGGGWARTCQTPCQTNDDAPVRTGPDPAAPVGRL